MTLNSVDGGLDRYVLPVDQRVPLDSHGFLKPPAADVGWLKPQARARRVTDLIDGGESSFVLLAAGGAGKSTVLRGLLEQETKAVEVHLFGSDNAGARRDLGDAIRAGGPVYLDSLDDPGLYSSGMPRLLRWQLSQPQAATVGWRLACRPSAWNPGLARALKASPSGFEELRLLPLTRQAAGNVAVDVGVDPDEFLDVLVRANLGRLAANPLQLHATALYWAEHRRLPESHVEAIRMEIGRLLEENDSERGRPALSMDQRWRVAERLGAFTVFTGGSRFSRTVVPGSLIVNELPSTPEPDSPGVHVGPAQYDDVLGTALFDPAPSATVAFRHQQYAEYLAATYLASRRIGRAQLPALLGVHGDGVLPGAMAGIAAWLAALDADLVRDLLKPNALMFARTGVEVPSTEVRVAIIDGLLSRAAVGDVDLGWGLDLSGLAHAGLSDQLTLRCQVGVSRTEELWWVARLARDCNCRTLVPTLLSHALSPQWAPVARVAAIDAVAALGGAAHIEQLKPLLELDRKEDPDDEILASAINALYPRQLSSFELLDALRPRRKPRWFGGYFQLLDKVAGQIPLRDLPTALGWAADRLQHHDDAYGPLMAALVARAWEYTTLPEVTAALADLVIKLSGDQHTSSRWSRKGQLPWTTDSTERRRHLAVSVAEGLEGNRWNDLLDLDLIITSDVRWLINDLPALSRQASAVLARCLPWLLNRPSAEDAELILSLEPGHPGYEATDWLRQPLSLASEEAKRWRRRHALASEQDAELNASRPERRLQLLAALDSAEATPASWWRVASWLAVDENGYARDELSTQDLMTRPGWSLLEKPEQERVLDIGLHYLADHQPRPELWLGASSVNGDVFQDWSGVYLLTTLARHDPDRLESLDPSTWQKWASAIVAAWMFGDEEVRLRCKLIDLAPPQARPAIRAAALENLDATDSHSPIAGNPGLYDHLCRELADDLAERLVAGRYRGVLARSLLDLLVRNAPEIARTACRRLRGSQSHELAPEARRCLAEIDPEGTVVELARSTVSQEVLIALAPSIRLDLLDDDHLATLGQILLDAFPLSKDPPGWRDGGRMDAQYRTREARLSIINLLAERGEVAALERLTRGRTGSDKDYIGHFLRSARTRAADLAYAQPQPDELLRLLAHGDARLVRNDADLADVICAQLRELQHMIASDGGFRELWNEIGPASYKPKREDDISDWVRRRLRERLEKHVVVDREVQVVRPGRGGIGTRIDITATAATATHPQGLARTIVEAKLVDHRDLMAAMHYQLILQYLEPTGIQHGVYLVYWIDPNQRPESWRTCPSDFDELRDQLQQQADEAPVDIRVVMLDISRPTTQER